MKRLLLMLAFAVTASATFGCSDPAAVDSQREIALELRALRTALATRQGAVVESKPGTADPAAAIATAMAPLREVLVQLVREQEGLEAQQQALAGELKRWSQLLAQIVTSGGGRAAGNEGSGNGGNPTAATAKAEVDALVRRLTALEEQLKTQETRHQEVERILIQALDKTSARLEDFLQRIEPAATPTPRPSESGRSGVGGPDSSSPGTGRSDPERPAGPAGNGGRASGEHVNGGNAPPAAGRNPAGQREQLAMVLGDRRSPTVWWFGVAAVGLILAGVFALWLARENQAGLTVERDGLADPHDADDAPELWAAAALLGEAVGRLKDNRSESTDHEVADDAPNTPAADPFDEEFVIDDGPIAAALVETPSAAPSSASEPTWPNGETPPDEADGLPTKVLPSQPPAPIRQPAPAAPAAPATTLTTWPPRSSAPSSEPADGGPTNGRRPTPEARELRLATPDAASAVVRVRAVLAAEPRVLRHPEPICRDAGPALEVRYSLVPSTPAATRARLEARLRSAIR